MYSIATLTMNPSLDAYCEVDTVSDTHKLRASGERYEPGGGGINVARIFVRLGGNARCYYPAGGAIGAGFDHLVDLHQLVRNRVPIAGSTRASTTVRERSSGREYRFVPEGPELSESEWQACLEQLAEIRCDYLVASGSLPRGVPDDFYARVANVAAEAGARLVLDTSGRALAPALAAGGVHFFKPSLSELQTLVGRELEGIGAVAEAATRLVQSGQCAIVAVTLGTRGALLAQAGGTLFVPAVPVHELSAVGAGDSFVAAMVYKLCAGADAEEAFRYAMAAGAAAVCTPGTEMCRPERIAKLLPLVMEGVRNPSAV